MRLKSIISNFLDGFLGLVMVGVLVTNIVRVAEAAKRYNSQTGSKDFCIELKNESGTVVNTKCEDVKVPDSSLSDQGTYFLLQTGVQSGGGTSMTSSDTDVSLAYSIVRKAIAAAANPGFDTGTLANGDRGQMLTILITEVGTGGSWTLTPTTCTGFTSLVFEAVGDLVTLLYVDDTVGWIRVNQSSVQVVP